jgi:hypothetical protein
MFWVFRGSPESIGAVGVTDLRSGCVHVQLKGINDASMRAHQFWILILGSLLVWALIGKEILLSRDLTWKQLDLVKIRDVVSTGPGYERAWKQLAMPIYQASRQDPALAALLKKQTIEIRANPPADAGSPPASAPAASPLSSKSPGPTPPSATP